eukprot:scaffold107549_cov66-Phaeocystis_antarctica.AAC.3
MPLSRKLKRPLWASVNSLKLPLPQPWSFHRVIGMAWVNLSQTAAWIRVALGRSALVSFWKLVGSASISTPCQPKHFSRAHVFENCTPSKAPTDREGGRRLRETTQVLTLCSSRVRLLLSLTLDESTGPSGAAGDVTEQRQ